MKQNLDTGVEVYDNKVKKKQRHTTNKKQNTYLDIFNKNYHTHLLIIFFMFNTESEFCNLEFTAKPKLRRVFKLKQNIIPLLKNSFYLPEFFHK